MVCLSDEWKEKFLARIEGWSEESLARKEDQIDRLKYELSSLKSKIERLNTVFTKGTLNIDEFKELKNPLVPKKVEIEQKIIALQTSRADRLEPEDDMRLLSLTRTLGKLRNPMKGRVWLVFVLERPCSYSPFVVSINFAKKGQLPLVNRSLL